MIGKRLLMGALLTGWGVASFAEPYEMLLNTVHHNPGEPLFVTDFTEPRFLAGLGYSGQIPKLEPQCGLTYDRYDEGVVPLHTPVREWIDRKGAEFQKRAAIARRVGLPLYPWIDVLVVPETVMAKYGSEMKNPKTGRLSILRPRTRDILKAQLDEFFWRYPTVDGLTIRFGETYLHDTPHHKGASPANTVEEHVALIRLLREEVCVRRGRKLIYRTWDFGKLHGNRENYLAATDPVEPHSNLVFSIKHTNGDFGRNVPFNTTLGIGRHAQIVEVSVNQGGNYGKNAYPYYFARGVIDGFNDMPSENRRGLRSLNGNPLMKGLWLWTWGDGWNGPFFGNELWLRLNEGVLRRFAKTPHATEESLFCATALEDLGVYPEDLAKFRAFCIETEDAVYLGQHSRYGRTSDDMFWCRDNHFCRFNLDEAFRAGAVPKMLEEKDANAQTWRRLEHDIRGIRFRLPEDAAFARVSTKYGRIKYELSAVLWRMAAALSAEDVGGVTLTREQAVGLVADYDCKYAEWDALRKSEPQCPTVYEIDFGWTVLAKYMVERVRRAARRRMYGRWCSMGTSITWYNDNVAAAGGRFTRGYQDRVRELIAFDGFVNCGCNGGTVADQLRSVVPADYYTIEHGINDWGRGVPVGMFSEYETGSTNNTFFAGYRRLVDRIREANPKTKIVLCTPRKGYGFGTYLPPCADQAKNGIFLEEYARAVREIAAREGFALADFFAKAGEQDELISLSIDVALHPNDAGYERMAAVLVEAFDGLESNPPPGPPQRGILCLTFDDNHWEHWAANIPLFRKYGARCSFFAMGELDHNKFPSAQPCLKRLADDGHCVGLHSVSHAEVPDVMARDGGDAYWKKEIFLPEHMLGRAGIRPVSFAYPNNRHNPETDAYLRTRGFRRFRASVSGIKGGYAPNKFGMKHAEVDCGFRTAADFPSMTVVEGFGVGEYYKTDIDDLLKALDRAAERNEVVAFYSHDISPDALGVGMKTAWLERILAHAQSLGMRFATLED